MYIRNLRKPSPNKNVFKFASAKINDVVMCESTIEFDACFHHEYNDDIKSFGSQPEGFKYEFNGKILPYTPDTLVIYNNGVEKYHEYKPESKTKSASFKEKFKVIKAASLKLGIELVLVTDKQIRVNPVLNNLKLIHRYSGVYGVCEIQHMLLTFIQMSGVMKFNDVRSHFNLSVGETRSFVYALIHKGLLKTNLDGDDLTQNPTLWAP